MNKLMALAYLDQGIALPVNDDTIDDELLEQIRKEFIKRLSEMSLDELNEMLLIEFEDA